MFEIRRRFGWFYLLFYGATGFFLPYMAAYFENRELSSTQVGLVLSLGSLVGIFAQPLWSLLSDVYQARRGILAFACLGTAVTSAALGLGSGLGWLLALNIGLAVMRAPILPLGNALTFEFLERHAKREHYGPLRGWGSLGFAVSSFVAGTFLSRVLWHLPWVHGVALLLVAGLTLTLPDAPAEAPGNWLEGLRLLPERPLLVLFLLGMLLIAAPVIVAVSYLAVFMQDLGAPGWLIGLAISSQAVLEIPLMQWTPRLIHRFRTSTLLLAGLVLTPLRWLLLAVIRNPIWVLPAQLLHSVAIVSLLVVGASFMDVQLPSRWRATGQGLYLTMALGLGPSLGLLATGALYERYGMAMVWTGFIFVALLGLVITALALSRLSVTQTS